MPQEEKRFTARRVDAQFDQLAQVAQSPSSPPDSPDSRVVESLQTLYGKQIQQEQQSLEQMRQRLALSVAARQQEQQERIDESSLHEEKNVFEKPVPLPLARPRRPWLRALEQCVAAILVLGIIAGWFALSHMPHSYSGSPVAFSDTHAQPLGAPISTITGNFTGVEDWSPDGHTLALLQADTQKHELLVRMVNVTTKSTTSYPVLDSSWMPALNASDPFQIFMGRYLLALRADGKNQATLEIWDITGQRAVTTQTIPAQILGSGQVWLPWIVPSKDEQKLALFSPDGTVTIWDIASGQKLITCAGKVTYGSRNSHLLPPLITWYNHDQSLLFSPRETGRIVVWNTATGIRVFSRNDAATYGRPIVSPDDNYLAIDLGHEQTAGNVTSFHTDGLEILNAHTGQVLHNYPLNVPNNTGEGFTWLPDSQRLLMMDISYTNTSSSTSSQSQIYTWNVVTDQKTLVTAFSQAPFNGSAAGPVNVTHNGAYIILSSPDGRTMEIWQTSNGQKIATVTTPGVYAATDSFFYVNNQQMVVGLKGDFDIWDVASGQLLYKYHGSTPFSLPGVDGSNVFWSPDGKYLVMMAGTSSAIGNGMVSIWRIP